jgi:ferredoxin-NADP reductase
LTLTLTGEVEEWAHARGRTRAEHLSELVSPLAMAFVCGPPAMVADLPPALVALGLPRDRIRTDGW